MTGTLLSERKKMALWPTAGQHRKNTYSLEEPQPAKECYSPRLWHKLFSLLLLQLHQSWDLFVENYWSTRFIHQSPTFSSQSQVQEEKDRDVTDNERRSWLSGPSVPIYGKIELRTDTAMVEPYTQTTRKCRHRSVQSWLLDGVFMAGVPAPLAVDVMIVP